MLCAVWKDREAFMEKVLQRISETDSTGRKMMEREFAELTRKIEELSVRYDRLYDDHLEGLLSDRKFKRCLDGWKRNNAEPRNALQN